MKREGVPRGSTRVGHVAFTHWSISAATSLDTCHLAASQATTSTDACYVAVYHEATSLFEIQQLDTWQHQSEPPQQLSATWHFLIGPPHYCGPHHTTR
jgi:hypothetical protein